MALFSYSLGSIIVGRWVLKTPPRAEGLRRIGNLINGLLLIFFSGIQMGLDFFLLAGWSENLLLFIMVLALIQIGISKIRQRPETLFPLRMS